MTRTARIYCACQRCQLIAIIDATATSVGAVVAVIPPPEFGAGRDRHVTREPDGSGAFMLGSCNRCGQFAATETAIRHLLAKSPKRDRFDAPPSWLVWSGDAFYDHERTLRTAERDLWKAHRRGES